MKDDDRRIILETTDVIKQYHQYDTVVTAVQRATIKVFEGEFVAIIGASGSGKSTLLHLCAGLDRPNSGKISIRGQDITAMSPDELGHFRGEHIGMVFQNHNLIPQFTALENILIPTLMCNRANFSYEENLKKLITTLDITDRLHHLPSELSGGQQQRVAIARALALHPDILCFDEPTSALDPELTGEVLRVLRDLADRKTTMIIVTHEMHFARDVADRILFMDGGVVVEEGPAKQVIDHPQEERTKQFLAHYSE